MPNPGVTAPVPFTKLLIVSSPRTSPDPTTPPSTNTAPQKLRSTGPSGSGKRYSRLPSSSDVPPNGCAKKSELLILDELGSQNLIAATVGLQMPPLMPESVS